MSEIKSKQLIFDAFSGYSTDAILYSFFHLNYIGRINLRKIFVLDSVYEEFLPLSSTEIKNCKNTLLRMKKYLKEINFSIDNFYSLFIVQGYSEDEINFVFNNKLVDYKELLYKKWNFDLKGNNLVAFSYEEMDIIYGVVPKIMFKELKLYRKKNKLYGIEDFFKGLTFSDINSKILLMDDSQRLTLYFLFGDDLSKKYSYENFKLILKNYSNEFIEEKQIDENSDLSEFYSIFKPYKSKKESLNVFKARIKRAINEILSDDEKNIVYRYFSNDMNSASKMTLEEKKTIRTIIIPRIILYLCPIEISNVYDKISELVSIIYSREEVVREINALTDFQKIKLYSVDKLADIINSEDYCDRVQSKDIKELIDVFSKININLLKRKSKELSISSRVLRNISKLTKQYEFLYLERRYGKDLSIAIMIVIYMNKVSSNLVFKLTGIPLNIVQQTTYSYLLEKIGAVGDNCNISLADLISISYLLESEEFVILENDIGYYEALAVVIRKNVKDVSDNDIYCITGKNVNDCMAKVKILT